MDDIKLSKCLFSDLKTDAQRRDWFLLGRGVETGIIAPALQTPLANAYNKLVESSKLIEQLQQRNNELAATVEQLRDALRHLHHNAKASGCEMGLALDVAEEALESTPQQSLAERDANLIDKIISMIVDCREMELSQGDKDTILLIAQRVKDGE